MPRGCAAERHPDADFLAALRHLIGEHAVEPGRGQEQRDAAEHHRQHHRRLAVDEALVDARLHACWTP